MDISNIYTSNFADPNVGNNKLIYIQTVNLIGNDAPNYVITSSGIAYGNITKATLTSNFYSLGKVYDRNNYAPVYYSLSGFYDIVKTA